MKPSPVRQSERGFTLIELLVAVAVLSLLLVLLTQIFSMVSGTWASGRARADNFAQARVALSTLSRDLEAAALRPDLPSFFSGGGPSLAFFTKRFGSISSTNSGNRPLSLVSYGVTNSGDGSNLRRLIQGYNYGDNLGYSTTNWSTPTPPATWAADMGPGTLIMRYQFIGTNGRNILPSGVHQAWTNQGATPGIGGLRAVIISLAVTDRDSMQKLIQTGSLAALQGSLDIGDPGPLRSYAAAWQDLLDAPGAPLAAGGVPLSVLGNLRVFERTITLPLSRQ